MKRQTFNCNCPLQTAINTVKQWFWFLKHSRNQL